MFVVLLVPGISLFLLDFVLQEATSASLISNGLSKRGSKSSDCKRVLDSELKKPNGRKRSRTNTRLRDVKRANVP